VRRTCFFHAGCPDGFGAAWAVRRAWGNDADYLARGHEDPFRPSEWTGSVVVFVDISLENRALRALGEVAAHVLVLDHHVSARDHFESDRGLDNALRAHGHLVRFDLERSGATLAWHHFHPGVPAPSLLAYVEDQDLWRWKLPGSEEVNAAISSYPRRFDVWDELAEMPAEELARQGTPIVQANRCEVERLLRSAHPVILGSRRVEGVNSALLRSLVGHELAKRMAFGEPWGLVYRLNGRRVDVSLYSIGGLDVSRIAREYGGGGHRNAAGFSVSLERWLADFI
jgi:oligoribonuclease NrnB/cAMP/cGMP phosphodiesterase (DHH superfamily)